MARKNLVLDKMRAICLALPESRETITWGKPHYRVGEKIFAGYGEEHGKEVIGFKLEREHAAVVVLDPRFWPAPYVGRHGWVSMDAAQVKDWEAVRRFIHESYRLIAPRRLAAKLAAGASPPRREAARAPRAAAISRSSRRK